MSSASSSFFATTTSAAQSTISVLLIVTYGWLARRQGIISPEGEANVVKLGTAIFLPCLIFSEIGPSATIQNLKDYGLIIPLSLLFQLISLVFALSLRRVNFIPEHFVPLFIFNNVTSLPLLLLGSLGRTGCLDSLVRTAQGEVLDEVLKRGRVYILINALVGNLARFAFGPYLMNSSPATSKPYLPLTPPSPSSRSQSHLTLPTLSTSPPAAASPRSSSDSSDRTSSEQDYAPLLLCPTTAAPPESRARRAVKSFREAMNPPLQGGLAAIVCGVIGPVRRVVFERGWGGWVDPVTQSLFKLGGLFSAFQIFTLGCLIYSKPSSPVRRRVLATLFVWRFAVMPILSISLIHLLRTGLPGLLDDDPMLDFVLSLSPVGPPALTLAAVAAMASLPPDAEGQIARIITLSYAVTPAIAVAVSGTLWAVTRSGVGSGKALAVVL